jgi:hypothetical protein
MLNASKIRQGSRHLVLLATLSLCAATAQAQGFNNLYLGTGAGNPATSTGNRNTALGEGSLASNTTGSDNTTVGSDSANANTTGDSNTAVGSAALVSNTTGDVNTALGSGAMPSNTTGSANTVVGVNVLNLNTTGGSNTAVGFMALFGNGTGNNNTTVGANSMSNTTSGSNNIALGYLAGRNITSGSNNIDIGTSPSSNESNTIRIGTTGTQTAAFLAGVNGVTVSSGSAVFIDSAGKLGTITSSLRFKEDVADMADASDALMQLRPVTFHYKAGVDDGSRLLQYGLVAEEVAKVYPDLVQYDDKGKPFTVRYHAINAMLLNELQKQHGTIEEQKAQLEQQEARIKRLETLLTRALGNQGSPKAP